VNRAVVGVGSNIDARRNVAQAKEILSKEQRFLKESTFVDTSPLGYAHQPDFYNGAFLIETAMEIDDFREYLKSLENRLGRVRTSNKNGPRTIDLDIIVWNGQVVNNDFYEREFVKNGVLELLPDLAD
jgi:2-amino-4-hydroxy-6-hydroxymethyldihydropteridine diphosphokinase